MAVGTMTPSPATAVPISWLALVAMTPWPAVGDLARQGHQVVALGLQQGVTLPGVRLVNYRITPTMTEGIHPLASEIEVKVIRGAAVARACKQLQAEGFTPAVIYVHPAWGEALFLREVFPAARLVMFCEYFYRGEGQDVLLETALMRRATDRTPVCP